MELCSGGDLYSREPYTEAASAKIVGKLLSAISYMHSRNITHRDLKFENIMFENKSEEAEIKVIDFGLSKKYSPGSHLMEGVGTIYTMAPQVLQGMYTSKADLWSVGVIAYMLLSSEMPFRGKKRRHVIDKIMRCSYSFGGERWGGVSDEAKEFVSNLIVMDPSKRWDADQALRSAWLSKEFDDAKIRPSDEFMGGVAGSLKNYGTYGKLQKMALMVVAHQSTTEEITQLRKAFDSYDTANNGIISFDEFKKSLMGAKLDEKQLENIFSGVDVDESGQIHYLEFLAATLEAQGKIEDDRLAEAFDRLDCDDSGSITKSNLREMLGTEYTPEKAEEMMREADLDKNGKISWDEFKILFQRDPAVATDAHEEKEEGLAGIDTAIPMG